MRRGVGDRACKGGGSHRQDCYIPLEGCEYRALNVDDFHILSQTLLRRFVIIDTNECKSFLLKPGHPAEEMPFFEAGLRYLLAYPLTWGVMILDGTYSFVEASRRENSRKEAPADLETELVLGVLRGRGQRHVGFW